MHAVFVTGFPGFLGSELVERLLERYPPETPIVCLVQSSYRALAEQRAVEIAQRCGQRPERIRLVDGDITAPDLGLGQAFDGYAAETREIYHLAAVYDLGVRRDFAMRVNVEGTRHMLEFARRCSNLERFQYVSTCYVSGRYPGVFGENDLAKGRDFNNYYEETKHLAEVLVQSAMAAGLPTTIYRPSIVAGDSQTGVTQKTDGVYYALGWLLRQPKWAVMPVFKNPRRFEFNTVPSDYVVDALAYLSARPGSLGKVYHLSDPHPPTIDKMVRLTAIATGRRVFNIKLPKELVKQALLQSKLLQRITGLEPEAVDYFQHPAMYTCENTLADLQGSGIQCPPLASYLPNLAAFMRQHPEISPKAMV